MMKRHIPNIISLIRIILIVPIVILLLNESFLLAFYVFLIAALSDVLDGFLARHYHITSRLGCVLDPLADKLLMLGCFATLTWLAWIPDWVCLTVILRDVLIALGAWYNYALANKTFFTVSKLSKLNTLCQLAYIAALLINLSIMIVPWYVLFALMWLMIMTTILSYLHYFLLFLVQFYYQRKP